MNDLSSVENLHYSGRSFNGGEVCCCAKTQQKPKSESLRLGSRLDCSQPCLCQTERSKLTLQHLGFLPFWRRQCYHDVTVMRQLEGYCLQQGAVNEFTISPIYSISCCQAGGSVQTCFAVKIGFAKSGGAHCHKQSWFSKPQAPTSIPEAMKLSLLIFRF